MSKKKDTQSRPRVAVFGLGDYYRKLKRFLWAYLEPVALIDIKPIERLRLDAREESIFSCVTDDHDLDRLLHGAEVSFILTPHQYHASYTQALLDLGQRVFVEKPFAVSTKEIKAIEDHVKKNASIYFSDFYVDVRSSPLLWFFGGLKPRDWRLELLQGINIDSPLIGALGKIENVHGRILEKYTIHEEPWLDSQPYGGVLFDMMIHPLALIKFLFPEQEFEIHQRTYRYHTRGKPPAVYDDTAPTIDSAETYAKVIGILLPSKVPVCFEVGKNYNRNSRFFCVTGERGYCKQVFGEEHPLIFSVDGSKQQVTLAGDRYDLAVRAFLEWYRTNSGVYGWDWSSWAVAKLLEIKALDPTVKHTEIRKLSAVSDGVVRKTRKGSRERGQPIDRREFLKKAAWWVSGVLASTIAGSYFSAKVIRRVENIAVSLGPVEPRRLELISRLISADKRLVLWPGTSHQYGKPTPTSMELGYPHDLRAISPFRNLCPEAAQVIDKDSFRVESRVSDTVLSTGSPISGELARELLSWWRKTGAKLESAWDSTESLPVASLPYHFVIGDEPTVRVYSGMEGGREVRKREKGLLDSKTGSLIYPHTESTYCDKQGWLQTDFLLMSKVPLSAGGPEVVLISGGHGPSTQAIELLFDPEVFPIAELEALVWYLTEWRYYQIVFEVSNIEHATPMSVARHIRLSPYAPPRPIECIDV